MFNFYSSERRPLYYSPRIYSVYRDDDLYARYPHSPLPVANPEVRYRRALGEYLTAEEEYNALVDTRKAKLRAQAEALRRERARLRLASLARARKEQRVRQFQQGMAKALARAAVSEDDYLLLHHVVPVMFMHQTFETERPLSDMFDPLVRASCDGFICWNEEQDDGEETSINQPPSEPQERSVPDLESLLRERLQKIAGDEEVQDLARAILRHLTSVTGVSCPSASASSPEVNACSTEPSEGADLVRSHALKGVAAEAAKASFKAHRAEVAERDEPSPTSPTSRTGPTSLSIIRDIRSALTRLSAGFSLPSSLDFSDDEPDGLAYTPTNAPVRVYEHALDELLAQLDAVETDGDEEVRVVRRAAVKEVEKAIENVEKKVREAKQSAKPGSNPEIVDSAEADLTEGKSNHGVVDAKPSVDTDKSGADEPSSKPADRSDSGSSSSEVVSVANPEVALPHVTNPADSESVLVEVSPKDQSSASVLAPIRPVDPVANSSLAPTEQVEAVSTDDASESKDEAFGEQVTIDETTSTGWESTPSTPPEFIGVSLPVLGAIARSSTPVAPLPPSTVIPEDLAASLRHDRLSVPLREDDISIGLDDTDDEGEWTEI